MYIKQVIIQGFKSFREQTVVEPFDPGHNVIVGRNGSGKTNFFNAIQFVLSDDYSRMRSDQMQNLLHEGIGPRVVSAYVEIIFDNSDSRLPIDKDEVFLRRVIGSKKDQYFLNKKLIALSDVMNLLETAGFSHSNPYYIVKQGKINQMATDPDAQRLKILREVAGTRVYDERRRESGILLKDTGVKLEKINELLIIIDDRLKSLEEEKEELREYQQRDSTRRYIEYTIYERELKDYRQKLQVLEKSRNQVVKSMQESHYKEAKAAKETLQEAATMLKEAKKEAKVLKEDRNILGAEQQELVKQKMKLTLTMNDLVDEVSGDNESRSKAEEELERVQIKISEREEELSVIKPEYEATKAEEEKKTAELALKEQKRAELYAKLGRLTTFTSKEERDDWIREQLKQLGTQWKDKENHKVKIEEELKKDAHRKNDLEKKLKDYEHNMESQTKSMKQNSEEYEAWIKAKDQCQATRKEQYRSESILQLHISGLKEDLAKADHSLRSMVGISTLNGRDSVTRVLKTMTERESSESLTDNYHGLLIERFTCDKSMYTAVEVVAGNRLFFHVIESDKFATKILKEMNKQSLPGEATFMSLNRLNVLALDHPRNKDAFPMMTQFDYEPKFEKAIRSIFGRTLVCRNLDVATQLARTMGLDCVTMEGDKVSAKGPLSGGYFDPSKSRMETQHTRSKITQELEVREKEIGDLQAEISKTESEIVTYVTNIQKAETKNSKAKDTLDKLSADIRLTKAELATIDRGRASKEKSLAQCETRLKEMESTRQNFESELQQELTSQLSVADQHLVDELNDEIRSLTKSNKEAFSRRMELEAEKSKLENSLLNNLVRRRDELVQALQQISVENRQRKLELTEAQLEQVKERLEAVNEEYKTLNEKVFEAVAKLKAEAFKLSECKMNEKEAQDKIEEVSKDLEKLASKEFLLQKKVAEVTQKISELEALPSHETFGKLAKLSNKELLKNIEKINKELKQYSHVNKKALEQFTSFTDHKLSLGTRKGELDRATEKIKELMTVLEQKKYEAIQFTFKQVSKNFSEIFKKLVPSGFAQLVIRTVDGEEGDAAESDQESEDSDRFIGVGIRVSFTGHGGETQEMNQLSGGQKSLVALTLIFAIQRCDPAPFYLFDEIDQALDAEHRRAVADMIHELSRDAQFITTTFRSELLTLANKFYGVKFRNKVSHVECVTLEEAADFLEDDGMLG